MQIFEETEKEADNATAHAATQQQQWGRGEALEPLAGDECAWEEIDDPLASLEDSVPSLSPYPAAFRPRSSLLSASAVARSVRCRSPPALLPSVSHPHPSLPPVARRRYKMLFAAVSDQCGAPALEVRTQLRDIVQARRNETRGQWPLANLFPAHGAGPASADEAKAHRARFSGDWLAGCTWAGSGPAVMWFSRAYHALLSQFRRNGWFLGKDQVLFNTLAGVFPDSFLLVETFNFEQRCPKVDRWFGLPHFMQTPNNRHPECRSEMNEAGTLMETRQACDW